MGKEDEGSTEAGERWRQWERESKGNSNCVGSLRFWSSIVVLHE